MEKIIATVIVFILFTVPVTHAGGWRSTCEANGGHAERICEEYSRSFRKMQSQSPVHVDQFMSLEGGAATYSRGKCTIIFNAIINFDMYVEEFSVKGSAGPDTQEIIRYLNTKEGRQKFRGDQTLVRGERLHRLAIDPFIDLIGNYKFDNGKIQAITVNFSKRYQKKN